MACSADQRLLDLGGREEEEEKMSRQWSFHDGPTPACPTGASRLVLLGAIARRESVLVERALKSGASEPCGMTRRLGTARLVLASLRRSISSTLTRIEAALRYCTGCIAGSAERSEPLCCATCRSRARLARRSGDGDVQRSEAQAVGERDESELRKNAGGASMTALLLLLPTRRSSEERKLRRRDEGRALSAPYRRSSSASTGRDAPSRCSAALEALSGPFRCVRLRRCVGRGSDASVARGELRVTDAHRESAPPSIAGSIVHESSEEVPFAMKERICAELARLSFSTSTGIIVEACFLLGFSDSGSFLLRRQARP